MLKNFSMNTFIGFLSIVGIAIGGWLILTNLPGGDDEVSPERTVASSVDAMPNPLIDEEEVAERARTTEVAEPEPIEVVASDEPVRLRGTLTELMSLGRTLSCSFSHVDNETAVDGVVYVADDDMRGDFVITPRNRERVEGHLIQDGKWRYAWADSFPDGTRARIDEGGSDSADDVNLERDEFTYSCRTWVVDRSKFELPLDVKFRRL